MHIEKSAAEDCVYSLFETHRRARLSRLSGHSLVITRASGEPAACSGGCVVPGSRSTPNPLRVHDRRARDVFRSSDAATLRLAVMLDNGSQSKASLGFDSHQPGVFERKSQFEARR
jgi:hypothetical protein